MRRITPVRQLGKYLKGLGYDVYVIPGHIPDKQIKYVALLQRSPNTALLAVQSTTRGGMTDAKRKYHKQNA